MAKTYPGNLDLEMLKKTNVRTAQQMNSSVEDRTIVSLSALAMSPQGRG